MNDLAEFLLARIAEDEAVARAVPEAEPKSGADVFTSLSEPTGTVEMSPARVLAECEAKRMMLELHSPHVDTGYGLPCRELAVLALPYADHPDYQEKWKP